MLKKNSYLEICKESIEGPLNEVIAKLQHLAKEHGEYSELELDLQTEYDTFGESTGITVYLKGN